MDAAEIRESRAYLQFERAVKAKHFPGTPTGMAVPGCDCPACNNSRRAHFDDWHEATSRANRNEELSEYFERQLRLHNTPLPSEEELFAAWPEAEETP